MRLRALAVTTALALAATGLTACSSKIGQAAVVGGHRISQKEVDSYVNPAGPTGAALAQSQGTPIAPRTTIVDTLVRRELFIEALLKTAKGLPSAAALRARHDDAATQISQGQATGADFDKAFNSQLASLGFRASFAAVFVQTEELEIALVDQTGAKSSGELLAAVAKAHAAVSLSPRYGTWSTALLSVSSSAKAGLPSFVTIGSDTPPTATPAAGQ